MAEVFIQRLPPDASQAAVIELLSGCGQVASCRLAWAGPGKCKGQGWATLGSSSEAQQCVDQLNGTEMGGQQLRISLAQSDKWAPQKRSASEAKGKGKGKGKSKGKGKGKGEDADDDTSPHVFESQEDDNCETPRQ